MPEEVKDGKVIEKYNIRLIGLLVRILVVWPVIMEIC
jgi:hypothetical protein